MMLEGVRLMAVGMFTVFAFLGLLVGIMNAMASLIEANAHRFPEEPPKVRPTAAGRGDDDVALALALAEAMRRGRRV